MGLSNIFVTLKSITGAQQKWIPKNAPKELKDDMYFNWECDLLNTGSKFTSQTWKKENNIKQQRLD